MKNHVIIIVYSNKIPDTVLVLEVCFISYSRQKILIMMPAYNKTAVNISVLNNVCIVSCVHLCCLKCNTVKIQKTITWSLFSRDPHFYDKGFYGTVHVLFGVLVISANSCWFKSFSEAHEHEAQRIQLRWRIQVILTAGRQLSLAGCDIQGHFSGRGLMTKKQFRAWWSQGVRFDNLPLSSRVSARSLKCSNSNFGLFLTFP